MTNIRDLNQSRQANPFWDWVSDMERDRPATPENNGEGPSHQHSGQEDVPPSYENEKSPPSDVNDEKATLNGQPITDSNEQPAHPSPPGAFPNEGHHHRGRGGRGHGFRGRCGSHGPHNHHGPHGHHPAGPPPHFGAWGSGEPFPFGFWGARHGGPWRRGRRGHPLAELFNGLGGTFDMNKMAQMMKEKMNFDPYGHNGTDETDFKPPVDVFDTPEAFYLHVSLAGAKKQDLGVNWNPESFEIIVSGVIHRPGDEEFLKTLALDERNVGVFERKIKLGTRSEPVNVNADGINARMEDGVLMVKVPKIEEFVEIKKVDIE